MTLKRYSNVHREKYHCKNNTDKFYDNISACITYEPTVRERYDNISARITYEPTERECYHNISQTPNYIYKCYINILSGLI